LRFEKKLYRQFYKNYSQISSYPDIIWKIKTNIEERVKDYNKTLAPKLLDNIF
jgi:hypothetical protein